MTTIYKCSNCQKLTNVSHNVNNHQMNGVLVAGQLLCSNSCGAGHDSLEAQN